MLSLSSHHHWHYPIIDSTNQHAKRWCDRWPREGLTLLSCDRQTRGYGRLGRQWHTPAGRNLCVSYVTVVPCLPPFLVNMAQTVAVAVAEAVETLAPISVDLKWPNDLLYAGAKLGGILVETAQRSDGRVCLIIGLGLNVNALASEISQVGQPATSLAIATGHEYCRTTLLNQLTAKLVHYLYLLQDHGFVALHAPYCQRLIHRPGDTINVRTAQATLSGTYIDLSPDGALKIIDLHTQQTQTLYSGDLRLNSYKKTK